MAEPQAADTGRWGCMKRREVIQASVSGGLLAVGGISTVSAQESKDREDADNGDVIFQFTADDRNVAGFIKHGRHILCVYERGDIVRVNGHTRYVHWSLEIDDRLGTPLCVGEVAFVPSDSGILYAIDMNRGRIAWQFDAEAQITTQPVLHRSTETGTETLYFPTGSQVLIGIDPATGEVRNLIECEDIVRYPPLIIGFSGQRVADRVFTSNGEDRLMCRELPSGEVSWKARFRTDDLSSPSVANGKLAITAADTLHLYRSQDGREIDTREFESEPISPPTLTGSRAFIATVGDENEDGDLVDNTIHRMSTLNGFGADYWTLKTDVNPTTRLVVDDNRDMYCGGSNGVIAVDTEDGSQKWVQEIEAVTNPVLEQTQLHIGSGSGVKTLRRMRGDAVGSRSRNAIGSHTDTQGFADSPVTADISIENKSISGEMGGPESDTNDENQESPTLNQSGNDTTTDENTTSSDGVDSGPNLTKQIEADESDTQPSNVGEPDAESGPQVLRMVGIMTGAAAIGTSSVAVMYKKFFE